MPSLDIGQVAGDAADAIISILGGQGGDIADYARAEAMKITVATAQIGALRAAGTITDEEAALHLQIQKSASRAVLMAVKGVSIVGAEKAVNAGLSIVTAAVRTALGVPFIGFI